MRVSLLMAKRKIPRHMGPVIILGGILVGLVLARFIIISLPAAIMLLSSGIILVLTILLRKIEYLIFAWFVLTSLIYFIMVRLFPEYYSFIGRGIFWGILICIIAAWAIDIILSGRQFTRFDHPPLKATILIFLFWCLISLFTSVDVFNSVKKLSHIVIALVTSYMFYDFFSENENRIKKTVGILFLVVILISFIGVVAAGRDLIHGDPIYKKISLWFWNPNVLGQLLCMSIPILISAGCYSVSSRILKFFFVTIMLLALFFSFHRTSWLATSAAIVFLLWKGRMKISISFAIVLTLFLAALLLPVVGEDIYNYLTGERYTGRTEIWSAAWNVACDYPLLGVGLGNAVKFLPGHMDPLFVEAVGVQDTHSLYLKNAVEMGFASVGIMLAFCVMFFCYSNRIEKTLKSDYLKLVTRGAMASLLAVLIHGIFENGFVMTAFDAAEFFVILPYILMAMPFAAKRLEEKAGKTRS